MRIASSDWARTVLEVTAGLTTREGVSWPPDHVRYEALTAAQTRLTAEVLSELVPPEQDVPGGKGNVCTVMRLALTTRIFSGQAEEYQCRTWKRGATAAEQDPRDALVTGHVTKAMLEALTLLMRNAPAGSVLKLLDGVDWATVYVPPHLAEAWGRFCEKTELLG